MTTANIFRDETAPFDTESLTLKMHTNTLTLYGSVGVTDRLEIGGALPLVQLHLEGTRVNVYRGQQFVQASGTADASGVADVAVRAKYLLVSAPGAGLAVGGELRLPTGDTANLLGAGKTAFRLVAIGSAEHARVGVHGNGAFAWGGVSDEADIRGALTYAISPRVTATGEMLWRRFSDLKEMVASVGAASDYRRRRYDAAASWGECDGLVDAGVRSEVERRVNPGPDRPGAMAAEQGRPDRAGNADARASTICSEPARSRSASRRLPWRVESSTSAFPCVRPPLPIFGDHVADPAHVARAVGGVDVDVAPLERDTLGGESLERARQGGTVHRRPHCLRGSGVEMAVGGRVLVEHRANRHVFRHAN